MARGSRSNASSSRSASSYHRSLSNANHENSSSSVTHNKPLNNTNHENLPNNTNHNKPLNNTNNDKSSNNTVSDFILKYSMFNLMFGRKNESNTNNKSTIPDSNKCINEKNALSKCLEINKCNNLCLDLEDQFKRCMNK